MRKSWLALTFTLIGCLMSFSVWASSVQAQATPVAAAPATGFLTTPTEQLGVPGAVASGEITPEGDIYTGWAEYQLLTGTHLRSWDQPTRITPDPSEPLFLAERRQGPINYSEQTFTVTVAGAPVVYLRMQATNLGQRTQEAESAMQLEYARYPQVPTFDSTVSSPYRFPRPVSNQLSGFGREEELGEAFNPLWDYTISGRDISRDGELLVRGPDAPAQLLPTSGDGLTSPHDRQVYSARLRAGASASWTWQIPLDPPLASPTIDAAYDAEPVVLAQEGLNQFWQTQQAGAMSISLPETKLTNIYRQSLVNLLVARYLSPQGWVQAVNKLQYQAFWLRDSSVISVALDQANLHTPAAEDLAYLPNWQLPSGLFISQEGEYDGLGQALWEMDQHAVLTGSSSYAASTLAAVASAVGWVTATTSATSNGLLPTSTVSADQPISPGVVTGDNLWIAVGLRSAIALATEAGRPDLASSWQTLDQTFETHLDAALTANQTSFGHITPVLGQDDPLIADWGNYSLDYPDPLVPVNSAMTSALISWARAHSGQGLVEYGAAHLLHDYLGFPIYQTELQRGSADIKAAIAGLYAEADHTSSSGAGWEIGPTATNRASADNLSPHGTFAGQYISLLHNLLVNDSGSTIKLLAGVSPAWLAPGDQITVKRAVSAAGNISLRLRATAAGAQLHWQVTRYPGNTEPLVWVLPYWVHHATANGQAVPHQVTLSGDAGTLTLNWSAQRPQQSLAGTIAALNRSYSRQGQAIPLHPVTDW